MKKAEKMDYDTKNSKGLVMCMFRKLCLILFFIFSANLSASNIIYTVNSINDDPDMMIDGVCDSGINSECTLRAAIQEANMNGIATDILFNITGCLNDICVIDIDSTLNGHLPDITSQLLIDGSSQPGNATVCTTSIENRPDYRIVLNGDSLDIGLRLESGSDFSRIRGLNIRNFFNNLAIIRSDNNVIECNFIGTDETGNSGDSSATGNAANGIILGCDSSGNVIGGVSSSAGNLIAAQAVDGVQFFDGFNCVPDGNIPVNNAVLGNFIGAQKDGMTALNNQFAGISFFGITGSNNNYIGVLQNGLSIHGNVIGASNTSGVYIDDGSDNIIIKGNHIGTDLSGTADLGNVFGGVDIINGHDIIIGGPTAAEANVIAFNSEGVFISGAGSSGNQVRGNSSFENTTLSIDIIVDGGIDPDGVNVNDMDDADNGANLLMNSPDIISFSVNNLVNPITVDIQFSVDATVANAAYPLTIDAYFSPGVETMQGRDYLGSVSYASAQMMQTEVFTLPLNETDGQVALTTTDADGNTSEFSSSVTIGFIDLIFKDGFN